MNQNQNRHNLQRKVIFTTITWSLMGTFTFSQFSFDHLLDSSKGKARCSLHRWVLIDTQKDVMYFQNLMFTSLCCLIVYFILMLTLWIRRNIFLQDLKGLKSRKKPKCVLLWRSKFLRIAYTTILVTMGSILP